MANNDPHRKPNGQFLPGNGGRPNGTRNALQAKFLKSLAEDFEEHGEGVIKIVRAEKPTEYLKIVAAVFPKELLVDGGPLDELSDEQIMETLTLIRNMKSQQRLAS